MKQALKLAACIAIPLMVGALSGYFTSENIVNWYAGLKKPSFNPPNYLFGPVWSILYLLMGISFYMVLHRANQSERLKIMSAFGLQLILNFFWSIIFFKYHLMGFALIEILLLWLSIVIMIIVFYRISKWAAFLNIPYLLWVSFASVLNYYIFILNG